MPAQQRTKKTARPKLSRTCVQWFMWSVCFFVVVWIACVAIDKPAPSTVNTRRCFVPWPTAEASKGLDICITTLSDAAADSRFRDSARRNFSDVLESTWSNRKAYAEKHSYRLFNASSVLSTQRPPAWSKILAVQSAFEQSCDWVFWMDPDSLFMNFDIRIEEILPNDQAADLIITRDSTGYNAGMWMIRNCDWSRDFLDRWWSMSSFIRSPGDTKSGDNDALKEYLRTMDGAVRDTHVYTAPQCAFNSYLWNPGLKSWRRYLWDRDTLMGGIYVDGDFVLHFAGVDDKMKYIKKYSSRVF